MLRGRVALVTGVSRRAGIGYAVAQRLAGLGAELFVHHYTPHDSEQPWGADAVLPFTGAANASVDLADPDGPQRLMDAAVAALGQVDILVCNHALSGSDGPLGTLDAAMLDKHWAVNTRSSILLTQAFAAQHDGRTGGRVVFMTSGQDLGPMRGEVAYAAAKGALASITRTLADHLADQSITLNAVNPGPVDTGYATPEVIEAVNRRSPRGRWGTPDDAARLIAWLVGDDAEWITGQVINSEGGIRRFD
ncbi:3-ketoacyl-ACP reductase [Actinosynnema sp. ALI-1.44]|uniref:SDR family oxidoreductase n=1 Tax=Actinosynnema sp. ALI-1.44 TaxID=1933779 RepID=UPI00097C9392|nr:SDR family oxidoreductase [Actinosynnema sp. ALI-1.44]ONI83001.1 3-ketoacyl-ACP reductase [Actinosynnema sp. ALI-1.44]